MIYLPFLCETFAIAGSHKSIGQKLIIFFENFGADCRIQDIEEGLGVTLIDFDIYSLSSLPNLIKTIREQYLQQLA